MTSQSAPPRASGPDDGDGRRAASTTSPARTGTRWSPRRTRPARPSGDEHLVVNMGPQHPSTHGVLRLILTLDGETVTELRPVIGYLHTGIEKNMEYRTWTQGVTFCTRMDYLTPLFNEAAYCLAVEKLLGIDDQIPDRASVIRVLMMELNRISSHLMAVGGRSAWSWAPPRSSCRAARAGERARPVRADHRAADEPRLHPARRRGPGPAGRRAGEDPRVPRA